ncbi:DNA cytosine methyltransferase [Undibacterium sp. Ji49W]|uniref:DNA cytosine methyltransferase n=1 Tax=Undibacterium sp. Ji49W TaxID=3413040 RepID=UPI003BF3A510
MPTAVSLFSGCGGSDYGLRQAGFDVLMANDILPYAQAVYVANMPETDFRHCDVRQINSFPEAELLAGCYPCQGFSQGGVRDADRKINFLYREFLRALKLIKPKAFIVENVSGMTRSTFEHLLKNQIISFRLAGYRVSWKVLNAVDFGLAQERKRIFIVGIRSDINEVYEFPEPTHGENRTQPYATQQDIIGNLPEWPLGDFCEDAFHWYYLSRDRRRNWNQPSKTVVSNMRHVPLHPMSPKLIKLGPDEWKFETNAPARRLSYREVALLQGFPMDYVFPEGFSLAKKYEVAGNAVPPPLFRAVADALPNIWN